MINRNDKLFVFVLMASGFIGSLSQNLLTSALPSILAAFDITAAVGQWLTTSYILLMSVMTALSAYMFNRFPTRKLVLISVSVFLAGCIISLTAINFPMLLAGRLIQALGAGPTIPLLQIAIMYIYPREHQGEALGLTGIIVGFAPAVGPTLSGVLVDSFGWRSIFVFLLVFGGIILMMGWFKLRDVGERKNLPLDGMSVILYSIGFSAFMLSVTFMKSGDVFTVKVIGVMLAGILCLWAFVKRQNMQEEPLLRVSLLRVRSLVYGVILLGVAYFMNMAGTILVPLFNQTVCPYSATVSGMILLPGSLLIAILSPYSGKMMDRYGAKKVCIAGMLFMLAGNTAFIILDQDAGIVPIAVYYSFRCLGMTFLMTPSTAMGVQELSMEDKPYGMAILNSVRQMSGALFSTILVVIATVASSAGSADIDIKGMHTAFLVMSVCSVLGIILTLKMKNPESNS